MHIVGIHFLIEYETIIFNIQICTHFLHIALTIILNYIIYNIETINTVVFK